MEKTYKIKDEQIKYIMNLLVSSSKPWAETNPIILSLDAQFVAQQKQPDAKVNEPTAADVKKSKRK